MAHGSKIGLAPQRFELRSSGSSAWKAPEPDILSAEARFNTLLLWPLDDGAVLSN